MALGCLCNPVRDLVEQEGAKASAPLFEIVDRLVELDERRGMKP